MRATPLTASTEETKAPKKRRNLTMFARQATPADALVLTGMTETFFNEAGWQQFTRFNKERALQHFEQTLNTDWTQTGVFIICVDCLEIRQTVGYIKCMIQVGVCEDPLGVLDAVYVMKDYRLSAAGRILFTAAEHQLRSVGCAAFFASPGALMGDVDKRMANMLRKLDFEHESVSMTKFLKEKN